MAALMESPKRVLGGLLRKILVEKNIHIPGVSKRGMKDDFLSLDDKTF